MGSRANYVVIEKGSFELWYSHWTAQTLTRDLFWGPDFALSFIRRQERTEDWLDEIWCEGAALIDTDQKTFILFGGHEDIQYEPPLRRVYLELLSDSWSGWEVRWAHEGLVELADYVGVDRSIVLSSKDKPLGEAPGAAGEWVESITSVVWEDGRLELYPMGTDAGYQVAYGSDLLSVLRSLEHRSEKDPACIVMRDLQGGGLHLDANRKTLDFWLASPEPNIQRRAIQRWPGWCVRWHLDRFEEHAALTSQRLTFEVPSEEELLRQVVEILAYELKDEDRARQVKETAALLSELETKPVTINPNALIDAPQDVSVHLRRERLRAAKASYLERRKPSRHR